MCFIFGTYHHQVLWYVPPPSFFLGIDCLMMMIDSSFPCLMCESVIAYTKKGVARLNFHPTSSTIDPLAHSHLKPPMFCGIQQKESIIIHIHTDSAHKQNKEEISQLRSPTN